MSEHDIESLPASAPNNRNLETRNVNRTYKYLILFILSYCFAGFGVYNSGNEWSRVYFKIGLDSDVSVSEEDSSKSSTDGPYVFYFSDSIIIKSIIFKDTGYISSAITAFEKDNIRLTCNVEGEDSFDFVLRENLEIQPNEYPLPEKILVTSDIEGNFSGFRSLLEGTGVIDDQYNWTFDSGHLVLVGDFFDRGPNVTEVLWLIYKLEQEAKNAGGKVHFILGNHEIMNLYGDIRYVRNKYLENTKLLNEEYIDLYAADTELGRWLRTKNVIEKIGDMVFLHGGISPELAKSNLSLDEINQAVRQNFGKRTDSTYSETLRLVNSSKVGPYWYRGLVENKISQDEMNQILRYANASRLVVGHTLVDDISVFYENGLIAIDLDHAENFEKNIMKALWIEEGSYFVIDNSGVKVNLF